MTIARGPYEPPQRIAPLTPEERATVEAFHRLYYSRWRAGDGTIDLSWMGHQLLKFPGDLWMYQEIIVRRRPDVIIECGTFKGGSALFLASICDLIGHGRIVSIDMNGQLERPAHPRVEYLTGSSVDPNIATRAISGIALGAEVLVILDSAHECAHVSQELALYAPMVLPGGYMVVEDTNLNGHPVTPEYGPGPHEAVEAFLASHSEWERDASAERFLMTLQPGGYLRRRT